jgi:hypothetical protein
MNVDNRFNRLNHLGDNLLDGGHKRLLYTQLLHRRITQCDELFANGTHIVHNFRGRGCYGCRLFHILCRFDLGEGIGRSTLGEVDTTEAFF